MAIDEEEVAVGQGLKDVIEGTEDLKEEVIHNDTHLEVHITVGS